MARYGCAILAALASMAMGGCSQGTRVTPAETPADLDKLVGREVLLEGDVIRYKPYSRMYLRDAEVHLVTPVPLRFAGYRLRVSGKLHRGTALYTPPSLDAGFEFRMPPEGLSNATQPVWYVYYYLPKYSIEEVHFDHRWHASDEIPPSLPPRRWE